MKSIVRYINEQAMTKVIDGGIISFDMPSKFLLSNDKVNNTAFREYVYDIVGETDNSSVSVYRDKKYFVTIKGLFDGGFIDVKSDIDNLAKKLNGKVDEYIYKEVERTRR